MYSTEFSLFNFSILPSLIHPLLKHIQSTWQDSWAEHSWCSCTCLLHTLFTGKPCFWPIFANAWLALGWCHLTHTTMSMSLLCLEWPKKFLSSCICFYGGPYSFVERNAPHHKLFIDLLCDNKCTFLTGQTIKHGACSFWKFVQCQLNVYENDSYPDQILIYTLFIWPVVL